MSTAPGRSQPTVLTATHGPVFVITLNRPHARNAFDRRQSEELGAAIDRFEDEEALRAGVITGAGGTFSAGTDLKAYAAGERTQVEPRGTYGLLDAPPRKPLIAAVEGYAVGGGCELALACDLVVAAETARFGLPEVRWGLLAGAGGVVRLPRQIPYHHAMELALTGAMIDCERADRLGLVNRRVPEGCALEVALALAQEIAGNPPLAVQSAKDAVRESAEQPFERAWSRQRELLERVMSSEQSREGIAAFAEHRAPAWRRP
jgi:enoyl-CoA hydratase